MHKLNELRSSANDQERAVASPAKGHSEWKQPVANHQTEMETFFSSRPSGSPLQFGILASSSFNFEIALN